MSDLTPNSLSSTNVPCEKQAEPWLMPATLVLGGFIMVNVVILIVLIRRRRRLQAKKLSSPPVKFRSISEKDPIQPTTSMYEVPIKLEGSEKAHRYDNRQLYDDVDDVAYPGLKREADEYVNVPLYDDVAGSGRVKNVIYDVISPPREKTDDKDVIYDVIAPPKGITDESPIYMSVI
ncbi:hypothetical protein GWK47_048343 [Chionoecetes opilio]|uniref:Uncharacterized protein n=1 Tax=Chionoecetes opilio TaxID=41210 RepID=A0A8J4YCU1_CHIOP|nr:hypothetical protein GWK47_048343 [Chionoecetes opilio]